jgi:hypothetical protein
MNPQPANTDARIDQVLNALRATDPPAGLEARIAARLAQAAQARTQAALSFPRPSFNAFGGARFYTAAALTVLVALTTVTLIHNRTTNATPSQSIPYRSTAPALSFTLSDIAAPTTVLTAKVSNANLRAHPSTPTQRPPSAQDPDQLALAETLAPSRPAPPFALTAQEHRILAAMQPGQPIQMAELDLARAPLLRALAEARETARIDRYVKQSLAPLAVADALSPSTHFQPQEDEMPPPPPTPSTSSPN